MTKSSFICALATLGFSACRAANSSSSVDSKSSEAIGPFQKYEIRDSIQKKFNSLSDAHAAAKSYLDENPEEKIEIFEYDSLNDKIGHSKQVILGDCVDVGFNESRKNLAGEHSAVLLAECSRHDLWTRCLSVKAVKKIIEKHEHSTNHSAGFKKE